MQILLLGHQVLQPHFLYFAERIDLKQLFYILQIEILQCLLYQYIVRDITDSLFVEGPKAVLLLQLVQQV